MARKARKEEKSTLLSITQRSAVEMFRNDEDREAMLEILKQAQAKFAYECYAYCLLESREFHLILDTKGRNISTIMASILMSYSMYRNQEGKLFSGRFTSKALFNEEQLELEMARVHKQSQSQFNSFCFHCQDARKPEQFKIILDARNIHVGQIEETISLAEAQRKLESWMALKGCNFEKLKRDKQLRNQCIQEFRRTTNCSLMTIGQLFSISESSVSKILKNQ